MGVALTETEWLGGTDPRPMVAYLRGKASDRKLRLFACACGRRVWQQLTESGAAAVTVAERFADGAATLAQVAAARKAVVFGEDAWWTTYDADGEVVAISPQQAAQASTLEGAQAAAERVLLCDAVAECHLLREVFGNPFRPAAVLPAWRRWNGGTVVQIAQDIYEERAFDRLAILADALQDAGCASDDILNHGRQPGEHARGCWVLDALLGME
jgi:hypothetical protein